MQHGNEEESALIRQAIEQGNGRHLLETVLATMKRCGSLEYTYIRAQEEVQKAINALNVIDDSIYKEALIGLAHIAIQRHS